MAIQQGMNQQTATAQHIIRKAMGATGTRRKRRSKSGGATKRRARRTRGSKGSSRRRTGAKKNRLVAGSAAAKAWGRKMKRLRKRR